MLGKRSSDQQRVLDQLKNYLPDLELALAVRLSRTDAVQECSRSGSTLSGVVNGDDRSSRNVSLAVMPGGDIIPSCSCRVNQENYNQWCEHAAALLLRSVSLGFFAPRAGFTAGTSANASWVEQFSAVMGELNAPPEAGYSFQHGRKSDLYNNVAIEIHSQANRLGLQVYFDNQLQTPALIEDLRPRAARMLANLFIDILNQHGEWDAGLNAWHLNSQEAIDCVVGLLEEFPQVRDRHDQQPIGVGSGIIETQVGIEWIEHGAFAHLDWSLIPADIDNGASPTQKIGAPVTVFGYEPAYAVHSGKIYRLSDSASAMVGLFSRNNSQTIPGSSLGILLELVSNNTSPWLTEINPDKRPESLLATPEVELAFQAAGLDVEHFSDSKDIELKAGLVFNYSSYEQGQSGVVFRPDLQFEIATKKIIEELGFVQTSGAAAAHSLTYSASDKIALAILNARYSVFPDHWKVSGIEEIRKKLKFGELQLDINLGGKSDKPDKEELSGKSLVSCEIKLLLNGGIIPISTLFKSAQPDETSWFKLENGTYCRIPTGNLGHLKYLLSAVEPSFRLCSVISKDISAAQALWLSRIQSSGLDINAARGLKKLAEKLAGFQGLKAVRPSRSFTGHLRHYQKDALAWLNFLREFDLGGILADEMGLGKTVQTLALLDYFRSKRISEGKPSLVVAPTSVLMNWYCECSKFTPKLRPLLLHGPARAELFDSLDKYDLVITSYALLRLNKHELEQWKFFYLILDGAQYIKNYQAATTAAAKSLRAEHRLALTGTPTENRPSDLWSIMDFVMPGFLGSLESFRSQVERPLLDGTASMDGFDLLRARTRPFILRRTKAQVERELPPKVESVLPVEMTESQAELYSRMLEEIKPKVFRAVEAKGLKGATISILAALLRLRQVCNHPNSIETFKDVAGYSSGKFNALKELIEELQQSNKKTLIFCQFLEMLSIIREHLVQQDTGYLYLDGSTKNRHELIENFNHNPDIKFFLISLKAGGFGINLTAAESVIIYDPWWNPAVEAQAVDRAHRIGQVKTVNVYRLVTQDSVEQRIMELKSKKAALAGALLDSRKHEALQLTKTDLENLFAPPVKL